MTIPKNSWPWLDTLIYRHCGGMFSLLLSLKTTAIGKNVCTSERENLVPPLNTEKAISQDVKRTIAGSSGLVVQTLRIGWIVEFEPWSAVHHHNLKSQPLSVGIFFARSASVGAVPGHCLARGTPTTAPVPALFQPLSSLFSLFASRALSTPYPVFMRVCGVRVVNGNCCTGGD
jgi:hypothetical protein